VDPPFEPVPHFEREKKRASQAMLSCYSPPASKQEKETYVMQRNNHKVQEGNDASAASTASAAKATIN
jgi:hypothetical protein